MWNNLLKTGENVIENVDVDELDVQCSATIAIKQST